MKLLYLWISKDKNNILINQGFNLGGRFYFQYNQEDNKIVIRNKKNYIENFYNKNVDLKYGVKDITAVVGANGSGKSTILKLIKDTFSTSKITTFEESILDKGFILVVEDEKKNLVTILYEDNNSKEFNIKVEIGGDYVKHCVEKNEYDTKVVNILLKKYNISYGKYEFKSTEIHELDENINIYFSNVVDDFAGTNTVVGNRTTLYDISTNALISEDIRNINTISNINISKAMSKKLNINQLEVFKKYENVRVFDFLVNNWEFNLPFEVPQEITVQFKNMTLLNLDKDPIIYKDFEKIKADIIGSEKFTSKPEPLKLVIKLLLFLINDIWDTLLPIEGIDYSFLKVIFPQLDIEHDYYPIHLEYDGDYDSRNIGYVETVCNNITEDFLIKCNKKQKDIAKKLKENLSEVINLNKDLKKVDKHITTSKKLVDQCEKLASQMSLKRNIERVLSTEIKNKLLDILNADDYFDKVLTCIDYIGNLIEENYSQYYMSRIGSFDAIYTEKFFKTDIVKIKKLVELLCSENIEISDIGILKLDLNTHKNEIKQFIDCYTYSNFIYRICTVNYRDISSGQRAFLNICSRFYSVKKELEVRKNSCKNILVLIDEIDLYFHPQWQKELIYNISYLLSNLFIDKNIQVILSSHSPLVLSDIQKCNIIFMDKCQVCNGIDDESETFASNIHMLFTDSFFVKEGLIGKLAKEKINQVINILTSSNNFKDNHEKEFVKRVIYSIGEPVIRNKLINMYKHKIEFDTRDEVDILKEKMKYLTERIEKLENNKSEA